MVGMKTATKTTTANTIAAYIRVTRDESVQTGLSIPAQIDGARQYARRAGLADPELFVEQKAVGAHLPLDKRTAGKQLLSAMQSGGVTDIIIRDLDRLTRDTRLGLELVDLFREEGIRLHTFSGPIPLTTASDQFAFTIRAAAAALEKGQTADRVKRAKAEAIKQGRWAGGPPPFGYQSQARFKLELTNSGVSKEEAEQKAVTKYPNRGKLFIDPAEAATLRVIYKLAITEGLGSRRICNRLNKDGHRTRTGGFWSAERLSKTLLNPAAAGYLNLREDGGTSQLMKGNHEAIVTLDEWKKVREDRVARTDMVSNRGVSAASNLYPFSGVIQCRCGAPMKVKGGRYCCTRAAYFGRGADVVNGCKEKVCSIKIPLAHAAIWAKVRELIGGPDLIDRVYAAVQKQVRKGTDPSKALDRVNDQLTTWYGRHDNARNDVEREAAWTRILDLTEQKKSFQAMKAQVIGKEHVARYFGEMVKVLDKHGGDDATRFVKSLVDHHGLSVRLADGDGERCTLAITMQVRAGGAKQAVQGRVGVEGNVVFAPHHSSDQWVIENEGKHFCEHCGKVIKTRREWFWMGVPKFHQRCHSRHLIARRLGPIHEAGLITASDLARKCGVGRTTIGRWIASGKLPKPKRVNGALCFPASVSTSECE